jgi:hypothetical protein
VSHICHKISSDHETVNRRKFGVIAIRHLFPDTIGAGSEESSCSATFDSRRRMERNKEEAFLNSSGCLAE